MFAEPGPAALLRRWTARYAISIPCAAAATAAATAAALFRRAPVRIGVCALIGQPSDHSDEQHPPSWTTTDIRSPKVCNQLEG
ncbi:hypothetical protein Q8A67_011379 [Cirrhinus molitorella]|uniref:Uncharacterized protein n=1 Tax=Cirrhinus molitorella TaxID=172907 RepID=A0AA88PMZ9_9TELE|nr:hypothetical protein Q8A67_011379 [Cirrhinus molitorella]